VQVSFVFSGKDENRCQGLVHLRSLAKAEKKPGSLFGEVTAHLRGAMARY
jgi:hypothetical protein